MIEIELVASQAAVAHVLPGARLGSGVSLSLYGDRPKSQEDLERQLLASHKAAQVLTITAAPAISGDTLVRAREGSRALSPGLTRALSPGLTLWNEVALLVADVVVRKRLPPTTGRDEPLRGCKLTSRCHQVNIAPQ